MKEVPVSNSERAFIADVIGHKQRLDGRDLDQFRALKINYGADWGSVHVALGETRCLAQVSCSVVQPKATRPTEGLLFLKVDVGPMAAPHFEANRTPSDLAVQVDMADSIFVGVAYVIYAFGNRSPGFWSAPSKTRTAWIWSRCALWPTRGSGSCRST